MGEENHGSFFYAWRGLKRAFLREENFRIHVFFAFLVIFVAVVLRVDVRSDAILTLCMVIVLGMELVNSAVEKCVDIMKPRLHEQAEAIKDILAAAVFVCALGAAIIGFLVLYRPAIEFVSSFVIN